LRLIFAVVKLADGCRRASVAVAAGQPANLATSLSGRAFVPQRSSGAPFQSSAAGVGHPIKPVSDFGSTDARSRERDRPEGVAQFFHVILYKVDPRLAVLARNLLSKERWRLVLADEVMPRWPEVPLVIKPSAFACRAERLARTGTGPNRSIIGPAGETKRVAPDADAGEEVALCEAGEVGRIDVLDASAVNDSISDVSFANQVL
jgi:hypothetical protein